MISGLRVDEATGCGCGGKVPMEGGSLSSDSFGRVGRIRRRGVRGGGWDGLGR